MKRSIFALALAAALPLSAHAADGLNYNYVELDYGRATADNTDLDFDGFGIKGSVKVAEPVYLFGAYQQGSDDFLGVDFDSKQYQLGVGYRHGISDKADFIGELSYIKQEIDVAGFGNVDADGGRISGGVRGELAKNFEGYVKANYNDGGDFDGDFSGTLGAQVKFNETWGLTGEAEIGSDAKLYTIGLRASF
jgi:Ax21 family sulfation-dependent quorum factor